MTRDFSVYLEDILGAISKIRRYTNGLSKQTFAADEKTLDAVVRNLEVIGEAVKQLPPELRARAQRGVAEDRRPSRCSDPPIFRRRRHLSSAEIPTFHPHGSRRRRHSIQRAGSGRYSVIITSTSLSAQTAWIGAPVCVNPSKRKAEPRG